MDSKKVILNHYKYFNKDPVYGVSVMELTNIYKWDLIVQGMYDTYYEGGEFRIQLLFPKDYPFSPPKMIFKTPIYHPNIYKTGEVCISILHKSGDGEYGYEKAEDRWRPIHNVNTILLSVISMLSSPNDESPANVDAAKDWRDYKNKINKNFIKKVNKCVRNSIK